MAKKYPQLMIMAFPCNQFFGQEKGSEQEIKDFVKSKFNVNFPMFSKVEVNGPNTHEVFRFLRMNSQLKTGNRAKEIQWNFAKFLIDRYGKVEGYYEPSIEPATLEPKIRTLLA